jgi:hypothetical protein
MTANVSDIVTRVAGEYSDGDDRPLGGYLAAMASFAVTAAGLGALVWKRGRSEAIADLGWSDILLTTFATQRTSRTLAKDPVTSPLRAPFTRFRGQSGEAEVAEEPRGGDRLPVRARARAEADPVRDGGDDRGGRGRRPAIRVRRPAAEGHRLIPRVVSVSVAHSESTR